MKILRTVKVMLFIFLMRLCLQKHYVNDMSSHDTIQCFVSPFLQELKNKVVIISQKCTHYVDLPELDFKKVFYLQIAFD